MEKIDGRQRMVVGMFHPCRRVDVEVAVFAPENKTGDRVIGAAFLHRFRQQVQGYFPLSADNKIHCR